MRQEKSHTPPSDTLSVRRWGGIIGRTTVSQPGLYWKSGHIYKAEGAAVTDRHGITGKEGI